MFSLLSLYFAARRDVVLAERYMPALADKAVAEAADAQPVATETEVAAPAEKLPLAA
ncbi:MULTISPECIES: hypothetical protein [Sphingomonadaceae]|uniref:hypothetical protein n=1 Tax=Sphingomonadaceae TaxID=41297 RepID=UPI00163C8A38|nr:MULTISPECIES: hypothetical protein [Sphingomonadaceae]